MKGKLDDGTPVDIEKPGVILQDGKWWEFVEFRKAEVGETIYDDKCCQTNLLRMASGHTVSEYWIASEIPRATPEQLKAIGMKERDGKPVICKHDDVVWNGGGFTRLIDFIYNWHIGKYRFVLVPDVQPKKHTTCSGCYYEWAPGERVPISCDSCFDWYNLFGVRKNYTTTQPPRPEEPRFSVEEIESYLNGFLGVSGQVAKNYLNDCESGIKAFTERRRNEGKM